MSQVKKSLRLGQLLDARESGAEKHDNLTAGDAAFLMDDYAAAAAAYQARKKPSTETAAKLGFCLAMLDDAQGARKHLTSGNVGKHPTALAVLAWIVHRTNPGFGRAVGEVGKTIDDLVRRALAPASPPADVFHIVFLIRGEYSRDSLPLAERACELYPAWDQPRGIRAELRLQAALQQNQEPDAAELDVLLRFVPTTRRARVLGTAYRYALALGRLDSADAVVDAVEALLATGPHAADQTTLLGLAALRSMTDVYRARSGDPDGYERAGDRLAPYVEAEVDDQLIVPKLLLQIGVETNDVALMAHYAGILVDRMRPGSQSATGCDLDNWCPVVAGEPMVGVLSHNTLLSLVENHARIQASLTGDIAARWELFVALDCVSNDVASSAQAMAVRRVACSLPPESWSEGYASFLDYDPVDYAGAGAFLAAVSEQAAGWSNDDVKYLEGYISDLVDADSTDIARIFRGALMWLQQNEGATGQELLSRWGEVMCEAGATEELTEIASLSLKRGESRVARILLDTAAGITPRARALSAYGDPDKARLRPADLTLLEAAALIALLRGCTVDHVTWATTTLENADRAFEPTRSFVKTLFALMSKGAIAVHSSTPDNVLTIEDGRLKAAHLQKVHWRISPFTLELQRSIRGLPRSAWPDHWTAHAYALAQDLGVEELVAYAELLLDDRGLPVPDQEDLRPVYRQQLEQLSMAQCYYLTYKSMRETLDYKARYRAGQAQIAGRMVNLLRGNGEKAIANGWDTRYERVRDLPPSLLHEALHDVLTGWGSRSFDEPMMSLPLTQLAESPTKH